MKLRIIVEVIDEETDKGTRRRRIVDVPSKTLNTHKILCENRKELRSFIANDVMSAALVAVLGRQSDASALNEGFSSGPLQRGNDYDPETSKKRASNRVEALLGLDVIDHMDGLERKAKRVEKVQETQSIGNGEQSLPEFKWGSVGYGPDRSK